MRHAAFAALTRWSPGCLAVLLFTSFLPARAAAPPRKEKTIKAFNLKDGTGKSWALEDARDKKAIVVVFLGTECPINNLYLSRLSELHKTLADKNVSLIGINSNVHDTPTRVLAHAKANSVPFPILKDTANVVADDFGARRTPEAFILSPAGKVLYQGRIDDQFGIGFKRTQPLRKDLEVALDEILARKPVSKPVTEVAGCLIARAIPPKRNGKITWAKHVSHIFQNRCQQCHRPGQIGPMPLTNYEDALSWSEMIREVVSEKRMPPWHADPRHGRFSNDRSLTTEERDAILGWVKEGCPQGDVKDQPAEKKWAQGWSIGKPDVVFKMSREFNVPAGGTIAYQYFHVPTNFKEDRWIQAAECQPGAREVVHHIIVYVVDPTKFGKRIDPRTGDPRDGIGNGYLVAFAPGDLPLVLPAGRAKKIPKGAGLVFQMHYTPDGVQRKDRSSIGLIFAKEPPNSEVRTRGIDQKLLWIPPGAKNYAATARRTFDRDVELLSLFPHMHLRGKDFQYVAVYPDGKRETLLSVPRYDFAWQSNYRFSKPIRLPAGSRLECTAHFDNSADNPNNPNPKKWVFWGDQTWEEMMIGFVDYSFERKKDAR